MSIKREFPIKKEPIGSSSQLAANILNVITVNLEDEPDVNANNSKKVKLEKVKKEANLKENNNIPIDKDVLRYCKKFNGALFKNIGVTWFKALEKEFQKPYFRTLDEFLARERTRFNVFPIKELVWSWTHYFSVLETKVVIIGKSSWTDGSDPHTLRQAHGLSFSVRRGTRIPVSTANMFKELERDSYIPGFKSPDHGCLEGWAKQGVLLLNTILTTRSADSTRETVNSHKDKGWEKFTDAVIKMVSDTCPNGVVFILWGKYIIDKETLIDCKKHHILKSSSPSPLGAHRGFMGNWHFSKCNKFLVKGGRDPIDWSRL